MPTPPIRRALLSVSDKTGIVALATALAETGVALISTGGTARALAEAGLEVVEVAEVSGQPEILDGRVKTLHPAIHAGLLTRRDRPDHMATLEAQGLAPIDLLVVNLYPFEATVASGADRETCVENIDVGGPAMIRAAAKNHDSVAVVTDPADYPAIIEALQASSGIDQPLRRRLAAKAFALTASYDAAIAGYLAPDLDEPWPERLTLAGRRVRMLRYGENPHQRAALYTTQPARPGPATARLLQGKPLSYNNLLDADAAFALAGEFDEAAAVIVKHNNPSGAAIAPDQAEAYRQALTGDPVSAFGGVVAFNHPLERATAEELTRLFLEVVIVPGVGDEAAGVLAAKANLRLLDAGGRFDRSRPGAALRDIAGGLLVQDRDQAAIGASGLQTVTRRETLPAELDALLFAWRVVKHVRSNGIVLAAGTRTVGIGAGQMSRVDAVDLAVRKRVAVDDAGPLVMASDAFFPFPDGIERAAEAGVRAVIQPGGSRRDEEVITAADRAGMAMVFTGRRHFRH